MFHHFLFYMKKKHEKLLILRDTEVHSTRLYEVELRVINLSNKYRKVVENFRERKNELGLK